jgi:hypothetical protein
MNRIETIYNIKDFRDLKIESKWAYTTNDIFPHQQAIEQPAPTSCNDDILKPTG